MWFLHQQCLNQVVPELQRFDRILQHAWVRTQPLLEPSSTLLLCLFILHIHELKTEAGEYAKLKFEGLISIYVNLFSPFIFFPFYIFLFFPLTNLFSEKIFLNEKKEKKKLKKKKIKGKNLKRKKKLKRKIFLNFNSRPKN